MNGMCEIMLTCMGVIVFLVLYSMYLQ